MGDKENESLQEDLIRPVETLSVSHAHFFQNLIKQIAAHIYKCLFKFLNMPVKF